MVIGRQLQTACLGCLTLLSIMVFACSSPRPPIADATLVSKYRDNKNRLEEMVHLVTNDAECVVIRGDKSVGCDPATVRSVLLLLSQVGAYAVYREGHDVRFAYEGSSLGQKGLSFCGDRPQRLVKSTDIGGPGGPLALGEYSYVPIEGPWYVYFLMDT